MVFDNFSALQQFIGSDCDFTDRWLTLEDLHGVVIFHYRSGRETFSMVIEGQNETFRPCDIIVSVDGKKCSEITHSLMTWEEAFNVGSLVWFGRPENNWQKFSSTFTNNMATLEP